MDPRRPSADDDRASLPPATTLKLNDNRESRAVWRALTGLTLIIVGLLCDFLMVPLFVTMMPGPFAVGAPFCFAVLGVVLAPARHLLL